VSVSEYEVFQVTTSGAKCRVCHGRTEFIDTPGLCVECAARLALAWRMFDKGVPIATAAECAGLPAGCVDDLHLGMATRRAAGLSPSTVAPLLTAPAGDKSLDRVDAAPAGGLG
jgi:hypothetical protein